MEKKCLEHIQKIVEQFLGNTMSENYCNNVANHNRTKKWAYVFKNSFPRFTPGLFVSPNFGAVSDEHSGILCI